MSTRNRILALLKANPNGLDDDSIGIELGLSRRQQANARCRELAKEGVVERRSIDGKIRNFFVASPSPVAEQIEPLPLLPDQRFPKPWFWEGNVVKSLISYLTERDWVIDFTANTEKGEPGADIKASRRERILIVEVKGYPSKVYERGVKQGQPKRTSPVIQARHWIAEALFTALLRQSESQEYIVAIAFPDFPVYRRLLARISKHLKKLSLIALLVLQSGSVVVIEDEAHIMEHPELH